MLETVQARLDHHPEKMTMRRSDSGTSLRHHQVLDGMQRTFSRRRLPKVATEMALNVLAYNMKRVMAILGVGNLLVAMQTVGGVCVAKSGAPRWRRKLLAASWAAQKSTLQTLMLSRSQNRCRASTCLVPKSFNTAWALSRHEAMSAIWPLTGVKRTCRQRAWMSAFDPGRAKTFGGARRPDRCE